MRKGYLKIAALSGTLCVILGAFGAHALKDSLSEKALNIFETAVRYQFYHVFALLAAGMLYKEFPVKFIKWAGSFFIAGMILFCGSLYALTAVAAFQADGFGWLGPVTPLGGLCFILGWLFLFTGIYTKASSSAA